MCILGGAAQTTGSLKFKRANSEKAKKIRENSLRCMSVVELRGIQNPWLHVYFLITPNPSYCTVLEQNSFSFAKIPGASLMAEQAKNLPAMQELQETSL